MVSDKVTGGSNMGVLFQNDRLFCDSIWVPSASVSRRGTNSMIDFENVGGRDTTEPQFFQSHVSDENGDDEFDLCHSSAGKKRRLTAAQVQFLERNFDLENKLEPERKFQLAKELGLQPRQVAIWFQNRRARFKNKQLERDHDSLKASYDRLKLDYDKLIKENEFLKNEILSLREILMVGNGKMEGLEPRDISNSPNADHQNVVPNLVPEYVSSAPTIAIKQDDSSSANFDPDSPHSFWEPADSSRLLEPEQSDFSRDEDDNLSRRFLPPSPCLSKLYHDSPANSCSFEFPVEEQPLWSWTY